MDWKTFISAVVDSLAWPLVTVIIVCILKDKLAELLPRLKRFKHNNTEIEFAEKVGELTKGKEEFGVKDSVSEEISPNEDFNVLMRLAEVSPKAAVMEAYRVVELAAQNALLRGFSDIEPRELNHPIQARKLLVGRKILTEDQYEQLRELRNLRNMAAHNADFGLTGMPIEAYIDIALTIANWLNRYTP